MKKFRWLVVVGISVLLGACDMEKILHNKFMQCPAPGGVTKTKCYYKLTLLTEKDARNMYMVKVAQSVLDDNSKRYGFKDYDAKEVYPNHPYRVEIEAPETLQLKSNVDYLFENVSDQPKLKISDSKGTAASTN